LIQITVEPQPSRYFSVKFSSEISYGWRITFGFVFSASSGGHCHRKGKKMLDGKKVLVFYCIGDVSSRNRHLWQFLFHPRQI